MPSSLLELPIELVYRIMDCLDQLTILCSMRDVCMRLNTIIEIYNRNKETITTLCWHQNTIEARGTQHLAHTLLDDMNTKTINLDDYNIAPLRAEQLADALQTNTTLTALYICENELGQEGAQCLAKALQTNKVISDFSRIIYNTNHASFK
ncbi:unnamed protein product [Rotaria socialis]|uniref:F-box domain-containing protein n=1 Tax=Rotaria socialis TaxID=392032 RepID=A0A821BXF0_9BILA|nr:unnamed protein product [Rotaria socialis]